MPIATAKRVQNVRRSFVREILKATASPNVISFAGGLPNPKFIPVAGIGAGVQEVLSRDGAAALQYCTSEGFPPLRQWIADEYRSAGMDVTTDQILITTGSQQGLDIIGKVLIDPGDRVIVEDPTYIARSRRLGCMKRNFCPVAVNDDGMEIDRLKEVIAGRKAGLLHAEFSKPDGDQLQRIHARDACRDSPRIVRDTC